jgi:TIR domain
MADIFISYSKADRELALKLSAYLESEGWSVWWDKSLGAGDAYRDEIMKQLASARAVIVIWTENSIKSDWVRAEAGKAKADGKLIPVKTPTLTYADIPLPFGEMHTENITSLELIKAVIVAQLAKPATPVPQFWQLTSAFKGPFLTWIGIVGGAITLFTNLGGVLNLADWARQLVLYWHDWMAAFWIWAFSWTGIHIPKGITPTLSFVSFTAMLVIGINLSTRSNRITLSPTKVPTFRKIGTFVIGSFLFTLIGLLLGIIRPYVVDTLHRSRPDYVYGIFEAFIFPLCFPLCFALYFIQDRVWVCATWILFLICGVMLLLKREFFSVPYLDEDWLYTSVWGYLYTLPYEWLWIVPEYLIPICWIAVSLFVPIRELTRRLTLLLFGMLTLLALNELSKLNLQRYLQAPKTSIMGTMFYAR